SEWHCDSPRNRFSAKSESRLDSCIDVNVARRSSGGGRETVDSGCAIDHNSDLTTFEYRAGGPSSKNACTCAEQKTCKESAHFFTRFLDMQKWFTRPGPRYFCPTNQRRTCAIRSSNCFWEATATSPPPEDSRNRVCTTPCGVFERRAHAATSALSSLRSSASFR